MTDKTMPALRFRGFYDAWEQRKLGELTNSFEYGLNASAKKFDGIHKYIRITDIDDSSRKFNSDSITSPDINFSSADNYELKQNDLLFARTGASVGKSYIYTESDGLVYYAGFLIRVRIKPEFDSNFVFQNTFTSSYENFIRITSQRSGQPGVNSKEYASFEISIPSLEEQQMIGSLFKQLDNLTAQNEHKLNLLKQLKQAYLQKIFSQELRFAGFSGTWEQRKLGKIGNTFNGLTGKTKEDFGHGDAKFVTYLNVFQNELATLKQLDSVEIDERQNQVQKGDVFFTTSSETPEEVGMSSVWTYDIKNIYLNSFTFGYRPTVELDLEYLATMLRSPSVRKKITFLAQGISRYNISKSKMMKIEVPIPNIFEQENIGSLFKQLDNLITLNQQKVNLLKKQKQAYLQKMFN
ncbi:restriction endonuclease subunit S [Leuconostoc suionicum]|uniref:restriction endonuclease subunit S n=1 Tax=Leuconostoc suionicum TaxID=1511761 RepID=UPI00090B2C27|nr:restriction endonuclease subunit S [Leuconostoc suionicum]API72471.1 restriction endonuclease [Leuconostoc suionicum]